MTRDTRSVHRTANAGSSMVRRRLVARQGRNLTSQRMMQWILAFTLVVAAAATPVQAQSSPPEQYRIVAGDKVSVAVFGQPDLSGESTVDQNGNLRLPVIGDVPAASLTPSEVEKNIVR